MATTTSRASFRLPRLPRLPRLEPRAPFVGRPLRVAVLAGAILFAELLLALAIADERFARLLMLPVVLAGAWALFRFPLMLTVVVTVLAASVFWPGYFGQYAGPAYANEVVLSGLLLVAAVQPKRETWGGVTGGALAAFFAILLFANYLAISAGSVELISAINWTRPIYMVALFWVIIRLFPDAESLRRLILAAMVVTALVALISLASALGNAIGDKLQDPGLVFVVDDASFGFVKRVRFPGIALAYGFFYAAVTLLLYSRGLKRRALTLLLLGMLAAVLLSLNRNMWLGLAGGLILMVVLGGVEIRSRLVGRIAFGVAALLAMILVLSSFVPASVGNNPTLKTLAERGGTLLHDPNEIGSSDKALQGRAEETNLALTKISQNLVTGVGAGVPYGYYFNEARGGGSRFVRVPQKFLHNQWLWLTLVGGLPLVFAWATFLFSNLWRAWRPPREPLTTACGVGLLMIMVSALVELYFSTAGMTTAIGLLAGIMYAGRTIADEGGDLLGDAGR